MSRKKIEDAIWRMIEVEERALKSRTELARRARIDCRESHAKAFNLACIISESCIAALKDVLTVIKGIK